MSIRVFLILLAVAGYLVLLYLFNKYDISRDQLDLLVKPMKKYGLLFLLIAQIFFSLTPLPDNFLIYGGVIAFGAIETFFAIYLSYLIATSINFWIARHFGKKWVFDRFPKIKSGIQKYDYLVKGSNLILYRFISFSTFDALAYISGFSNISYRSYITSCIISMPFLITPGILLFQGLLAKEPADIFLVYSTAFAMGFAIFLLSRKFESILKRRVLK